MANRILSPYEKNQLQKYGISPTVLLERGELPVEYCTGHVNFAGHDLLVTPDVLIPRVETEELLAIIHARLPKALPQKVLEVGTGSGAIILSLLASLNNTAWTALATDLSLPALKVAQLNALRVLGPSWPTQLGFKQADLLTGIPAEDQFSLILANLPYIPTFLLPDLELSVRDFEPMVALDGGSDGFVLLAKFLRAIIREHRLSPAGQIFLEVDQTHTPSFIEDKYPDIAQAFQIEAFKDQFSRHRFLCLQAISLGETQLG